MTRLSSRSFCVSGALALCAFVALLTAGAQEKKKEQPAAVQPLSVRLNALVLDAQKRPVDDLRLEDFQVLEDGVPQKITTFEKQAGPHAFGLLIDSTGSMRSDIARVVEFGKMIVDGTSEDSEGFVVSFVDSPKIRVVQDVTAGKQALASALESIYIQGGQTAINDAVYLAAERLAKYKSGQSAPRRYSLVLVTDGEDRASFYKNAQVYEKLRESGLRVFVAGFVRKDYQTTTPDRAKQYMSRLALESGGAAYFFSKGGDLAQTARRILNDMSANYVVGYDSTNAKRDGSTRKVQLSLGGGGPESGRVLMSTDSYIAPKK